jgi:hypothetical protein
MTNSKINTDSIESKEAFVGFVRSMIQEYREGKVRWENREIDTFLEGLADWTEDMDGYYAFIEKPFPEDIPWKIFADCLKGATMYE